MKKIFVQVKVFVNLSVYKREGDTAGRPRYAVFWVGNYRRRWMADFTNLRKAVRYAKDFRYTSVFPVYGDAAGASRGI